MATWAIQRRGTGRPCRRPDSAGNTACIPLRFSTQTRGHRQFPLDLRMKTPHGAVAPKPPSASGSSSCLTPTMFPARRRRQHVSPDGSQTPHTEVRIRLPPYIYSPYGGHHRPGHTTRRDEPHRNRHHHHHPPLPQRRSTRLEKEPG